MWSTFFRYQYPKYMSLNISSVSYLRVSRETLYAPRDPKIVNRQYICFKQLINYILHPKCSKQT